MLGDTLPDMKTNITYLDKWGGPDSTLAFCCSGPMLLKISVQMGTGVSKMAVNHFCS